MRMSRQGWSGKPLVLHFSDSPERTACGCRLSAQVMAGNQWPGVNCLRCLRSHRHQMAMTEAVQGLQLAQQGIANAEQALRGGPATKASAEHSHDGATTGSHDGTPKATGANLARGRA